ncbi:MAG: YHS domain-containing (seleno)protein [Polaribacter sp.]|uniref:YHS domain-containing (seleno)protein n=1 Tax=Polaribacter sp. TaxID=1920175 RepID=UPI002F35DF6D
MKRFSLILLLLVSTTFFAQEYNLENGYIANGFDVVSYFTNKKPLKGNKKFQTTFNEVKLKFSSDKNLQLFIENPKKYMPQCGGFCAYAIATRNERKEIDAESYEIRDGKLYLFYNKWFSNKLESWLEENPSKLQKEAAENWKTLKNNKD